MRPCLSPLPRDRTGVLIYNCIMVRRPLRRSLLACALAGWLLNASQLLLVARLNVKLGLSDALFALGDYSMLSVFAEVRARESGSAPLRARA